MKNLTLASTLLATTTLASPAFAQSQFFEDIEIRSQADTVTEYVFRGQSLGAQSLVSDTEVTLPIGLSGGFKYIAGIDPDSAVQRDEIRVYVNYSVPVGDAVSVDVGGTHFYYPQFGGLFETRGGSAGSYEAYGSVGFNEVFLKPKARVSYDVTLENLTIEGSVEHSFDLSREGWSANVGLTAGYVDADNNFLGFANSLDYGWGTATAGFNKVITDNISFYGDANFTLNSEDDTLNFDREVLASGFDFATRDSDTKLWFATGVVLNF
ncbi:hypothetical protein N9W89_13830 [Hellea sp.]|nr:hypothetical protein [Hellea sp.]